MYYSKHPYISKPLHRPPRLQQKVSHIFAQQYKQYQLTNVIYLFLCFVNSYQVYETWLINLNACIQRVAIRLNFIISYEHLIIARSWCIHFLIINSMKKQVPLDSAEWVQIDRQVQVAIGKSSVKLISAFSFQSQNSSPEVNMLKNGKDKYWVDAAVNITDFSKQYYRQVVTKQIPLEDLILYAGHINVHKYSNQPYKIFTFLLCKVCLGTSSTSQTPKKQNCDSILVPPQNDEAFQYNFFIKSHWQYQVKYQVNFTVSDQKQFKIGELSCCSCQNRTPTIFCANQNLYFCEECCTDHHKPKLMHSHVLESIDKVNTLQNCKSHNQKFQLYCLTCQKYLCPMCVQKGIHSSGTDHIVKPIRYYYSQLQENIEVLPKKSLQKIDVLLYNLKIKRQQVVENQKQIRQKIEMEYKRMLKMLEQQMAKKYQMLDSNQLQLQLLKDKISWNQSFSLFQSQSLKPIHYFKSQVVFEDEIKKLKVSDFDSILNCKPDVIYQGYNIIGPKVYVQKNLIAKKLLQTKVANYQESEKKERQNHKRDVEIQNEQIEKSKNILGFDPNAEFPPKNYLMNQLLKSNFKFFQVKSR